MKRINVVSMFRYVSPALTSAAVAIVLIVASTLNGPAAAPHHGAELPQPSPELKPGDIVKIVVEALAKNDQPYANAGIETTFNFASPANKAFTGPLERFVRLVKGPVFGRMVDHRDSTLSEVVRDGDRAIRLVQIVDADNRTVYYAFRLGLQREGEYAGMWLTEAVWPLENPERNVLVL